MALPLKPPIQPQLARSAKDLPSGDGWRFEPKYDGFRATTCTSRAATASR
jgi:ATP-dependent DNA ligase